MTMNRMKNTKIFGLSLFLLICVLSLPTYAAIAYEDYEIAVLQGLDKPNARVKSFEVPVGKSVTFGPLKILARSCRKPPPEEAPDSVAFLEITDQRLKDDAANLFNGWMFASSPALSAMEHPTYDVWVLNCKKPVLKPEPPQPPAEEKPPVKLAVPDKAKAKKR